MSDTNKPKKAKLTLSVEEDVVKRAKKAAIDRGTTVSDVVAECLRRFAESNESGQKGGMVVAA